MDRHFRRSMIPAAMATALATIAGCAASESSHIFGIRPHMNTCEVVLVGPAEVGDMRLWVPEGIATNTGFSSVYPVGSAWTRVDGCWVHGVTEAGLFGPGNFTRVATDTLECAGIRVPVDEPVEWTTTLRPTTDGVAFSIRLTNRGTRPIHKAGAAICLKFFKAPWWSDANTFVRSDGHVKSLAALGRDSGIPNGFEAYLMKGESYDNPFYQQFWGFNRHRLDLPLMVSHNTTAGRCIVIEAPHAYFLHSNAQNPCTDIMLAFGDVAPETTVERDGELRIIVGTPAKAFGRD